MKKKKTGKELGKAGMVIKPQANLALSEGRREGTLVNSVLDIPIVLREV